MAAQIMAEVMNYSKYTLVIIFRVYVHK